MNKLKLIFAATTCFLYANLAFAPVEKKPETKTLSKTPAPKQAKAPTAQEPKTMPKKYGTPTSEQEKFLNMYLNPYAKSDLASTKRTAESKKATAPTKKEENAIKLIQEINLDPNYKLPAAKDASRSNLIHLAVFHGYLKLLEYLVKNGADINKQNTTKWTPLHIACKLDAEIYKNKLEIIKFLISNGANIENRIADLPEPISLVQPDCKLNFDVFSYLIEKMLEKAKKVSQAGNIKS